MNKEMHDYTVDLSGVCDRTALHCRLKEALRLPDWYGRNLDALYDVLTDAPLPLRVRFTAWQELQEGDPVYFDRFRSVLGDAEKEMPGSSFVFAGGESDSPDEEDCVEADCLGGDAAEPDSEDLGAEDEYEETEGAFFPT